MANKNPFTEEGRKTLISEGVVFPVSNNSVKEDNSLVTVWNNQPVVSSRDIAIRFEKRHDHVLRDIKKIQGGLPNFGEMFFETTEPDSLGRQQRIYLMNYNGFSMLVMGFTGQKALEWKNNYINAFNRMRQKLQEMSLPSYQIEDPVTRARKWADEMEAKNKRIMVLTHEKKQLTEQVEVMKPAADLGAAISASDGDISVGDMANILNQNGHRTGRNRLFDWLVDKGYLYRRGREYRVYQQYLDQGLFCLIESTVEINGNEVLKFSVRITGKGQERILQRFRQ